MFVLRFCFFFMQKTAYEMRISDWSSDVCSSDLASDHVRDHLVAHVLDDVLHVLRPHDLLALVVADLALVVHDVVELEQVLADVERSEERRVGQERVSTCSSRWSAYDSKKKRKNRWTHRLMTNKTQHQY